MRRLKQIAVALISVRKRGSRPKTSRQFARRRARRRRTQTVLDETGSTGGPRLLRAFLVLNRDGGGRCRR